MQKEQIMSYGFFLITIILLTFLFFLTPTKTITGSAVKPQFSIHKQYLNMELFEQQSMLKTTITLDEAKQPFFLKDIKLTGKGTGFFRIWLTTPTGRTFLLLNSNAMKKKIPLIGSYSPFFEDKSFVAQITGFAVKENKLNSKENTGQGNADKQRDEKENNDNNAKGKETSKENKEKNKNDDTQTQNRAKLERKLEKIYGPSWLTPADRQAMKRATEPEKLFETIKFDNVCITCSLPDGIIETKHDLLIEIDGYLEIKEIDYTTEYVGKN